MRVKVRGWGLLLAMLLCVELTAAPWSAAAVYAQGAQESLATSTDLAATFVPPQALASFPLVRVLMPVATQLELNPYGVGGRPQIGGEPIVIRNEGEAPVDVALESVEVETSSPDIQLWNGPIKNIENQMEKAVYLTLSGGEKREPLTLGQNQRVRERIARLEPGQSVTLRLGGQMSLAGYNWKRSDRVKVKLGFRLEPVTAVATATQLPPPKVEGEGAGLATQTDLAEGKQRSRMYVE